MNERRGKDQIMESIYQDPAYTPEERARALLEEMTLEEKMAQVNCVFPFGEQYDNLEQISAGIPFGIGRGFDSELEEQVAEIVSRQEATERGKAFSVVPQFPGRDPWNPQ